MAREIIKIRITNNEFGALLYAEDALSGNVGCSGDDEYCKKTEKELQQIRKILNKIRKQRSRQDANFKI
jgi:hypothetical protein